VTELLAIVIAAVALACPLHMLWRMRRGRDPACHGRGHESELESLRRRQQDLAARIDAAEHGEGAEPPSAATRL
jgi:hypothetical protein